MFVQGKRCSDCGLGQKVFWSEGYIGYELDKHQHKSGMALFRRVSCGK